MDQESPVHTASAEEEHVTTPVSDTTTFIFECLREVELGIPRDSRQ